MNTTEETWVLSFYLASEQAGAAFFGRLARLLRSGDIKRDMTRHHQDEDRHAGLWAGCLDRMGLARCDTDGVYQDRYLQAVGVPANLMEALAITQVFERRVMQQYARHARLPDTHPEVRGTLQTIMVDERWHVAWIREALAGLAPEYGAETIAATLARYARADQEVYGRVTSEHADRLSHLLVGASRAVSSEEEPCPRPCPPRPTAS
jgi:hypothetical protein